MTRSKGTLNVRTVTQQALFELELKGQISDGHWENASPRNHWEIWCDVDVLVAEPIGRDFYARKTNYNFTNGELLEIIGERMIAYARAAQVGGILFASQVKNVTGLDGRLQTESELEGLIAKEFKPADGRPGYWTAIRDQINTLGRQQIANAISGFTLDGHLAPEYGMRQLLADLRELKTAVRTDRRA